MSEQIHVLYVFRTHKAASDFKLGLDNVMEITEWGFRTADRKDVRISVISDKESAYSLGGLHFHGVQFFENGWEADTLNYVMSRIRA